MVFIELRRFRWSSIDEDWPPFILQWTVSIDKNNISTFNTTDSSGTPLYIGYDGSTVIGVGGDKPGKFLAWPITDITEKEYLR